MNKAFFIWVTCAAMTSGCATTYKPEDLTATTKKECIYIEQDSFWQESRGIGFLWEEGVAQGTYTALYEDKKGVFFAGHGRPVWQEMVGDADDAPKLSDKSKRVYKLGGIWLPKDPKFGPRIYSIFEVNPQTGQDATAASMNVANNQVGNNGIGYGAAAVGGAIGGALVNAMIKADDGKIFLWPEVKDATLAKQLNNVGTCEKTDISAALKNM